MHPQKENVRSLQAQLETAHSAASFIDSIGVNVHLGYGDTAYGQYSTVIKPRLQEIGIRHIRDGILPNRPDVYEKLRNLATIGIHSTLIAGIGWVTPNEAVMLAKKVGSSIEAVESPNEYDHRNPKLWSSKLRNYIQQLHKVFKNDRSTASLPIVGPSFVKPASSMLVGDLNQWVDYGNMHPYNYTGYPGDHNISKEIKLRSRPTLGKPIVATEIGYYTGAPNNKNSISEKAQGKYIPRIFLENFNHGVFRTFNYELIDLRVNPDDKEANFGILRNDGTPKPAFIALKNLILLLHDSGAENPKDKSYNSSSLNYTLSGNTNNLHHTLLQKRDHRFYLILWQEVPSSNSQKDIFVPEQTLTLTLHTPIYRVATYLPNRSITPTKQYTKLKQLILSVPDYPLVIELIPPK